MRAPFAPLRLLLLAALAAVSSCQFPEVPTELRVRYAASTPSSALLATEGVTIRAKDGSFTMQTGEAITPTQVHDVTVSQWHGGGSYFGDITGGAFSPKQVVDADFWSRSDIQASIIPVEIDVRGRDKPLVGRMIFFSVLDMTQETSALRRWYVQLPSQRINGAKNGFVQTVFQPYRSLGDDYCSWVLSFSSIDS